MKGKEIQRVVRIGKTMFRSSIGGVSCRDCDIFKASRITAPHQYPLCYTHNMQGKETASERGLIVNWCRRHPNHTWKKD